MKRNYCFLILSCDKNTKLLELFLYQLFMNLSESIEVYAMMEDLIVDDARVKSICTGKIDWSSRLFKTVSEINEKVIILICDDDIVESKIDIPELDRLSECILENDSIGNIMLTEIIGESEQDRICEKYALRKHLGRYKTALQVGMWNKDFLKKILVKGESPWEFETFSNIRSFVENYKCYALCSNDYKPIKYNDGFFVIQGKVYKKERERLEKVLSRSMRVDGMEEWEVEPVRDNIRFIPRIFRRIKIMALYMEYFLKNYITHK